MIYRGNTYILHPTSEQSVLLAQHASVCRLVWNLALEQRRDHWMKYQKSTGNNLNWVTQSRELTLLRANFDFIREVSQNAEELVIKNLDSAFQKAFKGIAGFPSFKKKGTHEAFSVSGKYVRIQRLNKRWGLVKLAKLGWIKIRMHRDIPGKITEAAICLTALGWQVSISYKVEGAIDDVGGAVGIDRGVAVPIALSDGESFVMPAALDKIDRQHRKAQSVASRRKIGSNRHTKAQKRVRNLAARKARIRKDWAHKATTDITRQYGTVVIERLRTQSMTKSAKGTIENPGSNVAQKRGLNRAILNVGWFQIEQMLAYKAFKLIKINPAYTSQCCSACGVIDKRSRKSQADFQCVECGFEANADHNAAINILNRGNTAVLDVEGSGYRPCEASTADKATVA